VNGGADRRTQRTSGTRRKETALCRERLRHRMPPLLASAVRSHREKTLRRECRRHQHDRQERIAPGLEAITLSPARMYHVDDQFGSIKAGKEADLIVWSADPLELTSNPEQEMIRGELVSL
jgi:urease alpha subunit